MLNDKWTSLVLSAIYALVAAAIAVMLCCSINNVEAQQQKCPKYLGYDVLALAKYCPTYLSAPHLPAVSTLMDTFGNPLPCIIQKLDKRPLDLVQIDLRDATCFRNRVCPPGTPSLTDWGYLELQASKVNKLAIKYPSTIFFASPWLEHDIKDDKLVKKACEVISKGCPTCRCINSPFTGARPAGIPLELHGTKVDNYFAISGDGATIFDADNIKDDGNNFQHRLAGNNQMYGWWWDGNLRCSGEDKFVMPSKRTNMPKKWQFRMVHKLLTTPEDAYPATPSKCRSVREVKAPEIVKVTAEQYCNGVPSDPRGDKPLLIIKHNKGGKLNVLNSKGASAGCFNYYKSASGSEAEHTYEKKGLYRYYMGSCIKQTPWKLYNKLGKNEWGFAELGGGKCLRFNSIRRQGTYR